MAAKFLPLLLLAHPSLAQTVTITRDIPSSGHECIQDCLYRPYAAGTDLGDVLECGPPYEEDCYCPTAAPQATIVSRHIDDCASESCSRGDLTKDVESMKYYYAGYCVENGYTAELVEEWYNSAEVEESDSVSASATSEGETSTSTSVVTTTTTEEEDESTSTRASTTEETEEAATSTRTSVVTETASDDGRNPDGLPEMDFEGDDEEDGASLCRGVVDVTSVVYVGSDGSRVPNPSKTSIDGGEDDDSGVNVTALGVGLGVGVPLVLAGIGVGIWLCLRQRKRQQAQSQAQAPSPPTPETQPSPPRPEVLPFTQTEKQELHGAHVTREIQGTELHPLPYHSPSPPVTLRGQHEMPGHGRPRGTSGHDRPYEMPGYGRPHEMSGVQQTHEMPGYGRPYEMSGHTRPQEMPGYSRSHEISGYNRPYEMDASRAL